jgi:hypothetical protein
VSLLAVPQGIRHREQRRVHRRQATLQRTRGEQLQQRFVLRNDWGPTRCTTCGSPLPQSHDGKRVWVPAGLMDVPLRTTVQMHIHVASKADWETIHCDAARHDAFPTG